MTPRTIGTAGRTPAPASPEHAAALVAARLDRLPSTRVQRGILAKGGLSTTFDGLDNGIVSFLLPVVTGLFALSGLEQGLLGSSALIGAFAGAIAVSLWGDRVGRRNLLIWSMTVYSAAMIVGAFSPDAVFLLVTRLVGGVAIGINANIVMPYLAEFAPVKGRGRFVGSLAAFFAGGYVVAALIGFFVIQAFDGGWRIAQLIVGLPIVLAVFWRRSLPESPRYLATRGRMEEAFAETERLEARVVKATGRPLPEVPEVPVPQQTTGARQLGYAQQFAALWQAPYARQTTLLWILWFCFSFVYYGFLVFLPTLLVERGFSLSESFGYTILVEVAQVAGYFPAAALSERWDRKWSIVTFLLVGGLSSLGLAFAANDAMVVCCSIALAFFLNGAYAPLYTYTPEVYPTRLRGTGVGASAILSRVGAALAPIILGAASASLSFGGVFLLLFAVIVVAVAVVATMGISTRSRSLEDIGG